MSFLDTLLRKLGFSMEEGEEHGEEIDDSEEQEEEEGEDEAQSSRFSFRFSNPFKGAAQEPEAEEEEEPEPSRTRRGNVIHDSRMDARVSQEAKHRTRIVNVRQIEECRTIIQYLLGGESILLNLENIDPKDCGRVVDLLSGAAFALQGRMLKVAHLSYLLAPETVEVIEEDPYAAAQHRYR